jgi:hypothetical protein
MYSSHPRKIATGEFGRDIYRRASGNRWCAARRHLGEGVGNLRPGQRLRPDVFGLAEQDGFVSRLNELVDAAAADDEDGAGRVRILRASIER